MWSSYGVVAGGRREYNCCGVAGCGIVSLCVGRVSCAWGGVCELVTRREEARDQVGRVVRAVGGCGMGALLAGAEQEGGAGGTARDCPALDGLSISW